MLEIEASLDRYGQEGGLIEIELQPDAPLLLGAPFLLFAISFQAVVCSHWTVLRLMHHGVSVPA